MPGADKVKKGSRKATAPRAQKPEARGKYVYCVIRAREALRFGPRGRCASSWSR